MRYFIIKIYEPKRSRVLPVLTKSFYYFSKIENEFFHFQFYDGEIEQTFSFKPKDLKYKIFNYDTDSFMLDNLDDISEINDLIYKSLENIKKFSKDSKAILTIKDTKDSFTIKLESFEELKISLRIIKK